MRYITGLRSGVFVAVLSAVLLILSTPANAQGGQGQNAVYPSSGMCCTGSQAFIDASMFATQNGNLCGVLNGILSGRSTSYPATGAVIDARGLTRSNPPTSMTCTSTNPSPWAGITNPPPSTILLPATGGGSPNPIIIPAPWILPSNTHLIGEGDGVPSSTSGFAPGTTLQASGSFPGAWFHDSFRHLQFSTQGTKHYQAR